MWGWTRFGYIWFDYVRLGNVRLVLHINPVNEFMIRQRGHAVCAQARLLRPGHYHSLSLLAFNSIPQRSHHSLTLPRSRSRNSVAATPTLWMAQQLSK